MTELGKLTRRLESTLGRLLGTQGGETSEPLELLTHVLHEVEQQVQPSGGGRRRFPFTQVSVIVLALRKEDQDRCAAVLEGLDVRIRERLRELACDPPRRLDVTVQFVRKPRKAWTEGQRIELQYARDEEAASLSAASQPSASAPGAGGSAAVRIASRGALGSGSAAASGLAPVASRAAGADRAAGVDRVAGGGAAAAVVVPATRLVILRGTAGKRTYALQQRVIRIGRGEDHANTSGGTRHNDVAFLDDADEVNRTVARAQAHLRYDPQRGECRLFDDGSSNGTRIVRDAEVIPVTAQGPRGVRVVTGDILEFGTARVRIELSGA